MQTGKKLAAFRAQPHVPFFPQCNSAEYIPPNIAPAGFTDSDRLCLLGESLKSLTNLSIVHKSLSIMDVSDLITLASLGVYWLSSKPRVYIYP